MARQSPSLPIPSMASAQGYGSYYDGCYWSISFASSPADVITGDYHGGRNLLQIDNVMAVFGTVEWYGNLNKQNKGNITFAENGNVYVGQIDLAEDVHVLMLSMKDLYQSADEFVQNGIGGLNAKWEDGIVSWKMPNGRAVQMINEREGKKWKFQAALINGNEIRLDNNMLFESGLMRAARESAMYYFTWENGLLIYDLRNPSSPSAMIIKDSMPKLPEEKIKGPLDMEFIWIPAGEFPMGSPITEGRSNERPQRWVYVPDFYISSMEITVKQYKQFLEENKQVTPQPEWYWNEWGKSDNHAVTWLTWQEANVFCQWLSSKYKKKFRLPSEAEWEKAAKGFNHRVYPWGNEYNGKQAGTPNGEYLPVGSYPLDKSPFGVLDMAGGVWEWCGDEWTVPVKISSTNEIAEQWRSLRSCGWNYDPDTFRCSYRSGAPASLRSVHIGFRVVCEGF